MSGEEPAFCVSESEDAAEIVEYEVGVQEERLTAEKKEGLQMPGKASCHIEKDEKGQRLLYLITEVEI